VCLVVGCSGMMIMVDELVNIYKIPNAITRQYNYEKMLTMYNDTMQGKAKYLGIIMGATHKHWKIREEEYTAMRLFVQDSRKVNFQSRV